MNAANTKCKKTSVLSRCSKVNFSLGQSRKKKNGDCHTEGSFSMLLYPCFTGDQCQGFHATSLARLGNDITVWLHQLDKAALIQESDISG